MKLETAQAIAAEVIAESRRRDCPPMAIVILDVGAHIKLAISEDGVATLRHRIAHAKANAAIGMGMSTRKLYELFERKTLPERFAHSITAASGGLFAPQPGGELVILENEIIGAIGISGASSNIDEQVANLVLTKVGLKNLNDI